MIPYSGFSKYARKYDNESIQGLPSTFFTHNDKKVEIRLWKKAPNELIKIHEFLENILLTKKYIS